MTFDSCLLAHDETESYFSITKEKIFIKDTLKQKSESLRVFLDKETNDTIMKLFISTYFNDKNRILKIDTKSGDYSERVKN